MLSELDLAEGKEAEWAGFCQKNPRLAQIISIMAANLEGQIIRGLDPPDWNQAIEKSGGEILTSEERRQLFQILQTVWHPYWSNGLKSWPLPEKWRTSSQ